MSIELLNRFNDMVYDFKKECNSRPTELMVPTEDFEALLREALEAAGQEHINEVRDSNGTFSFSLYGVKIIKADKAKRWIMV